MQKYKIYISSFILLGLIFTAPLAVNAQEENNAEQVVSESASLDNDLETLDGVQISEVKSVPSNFGLWWRNIREWVSVATTFDPIKKAEKQLRFAEERTRLANYIIENSTDEKVQEKAQEMLQKANQYIERIEAKKDNLVNNTDGQAKGLLNNIAKHYLNKERVMEKIEDKIPAEKIEQFQEIRAQIEARHQNFLNNLQDNSNIPQEVKDKVSDVLSQVQNMQQAREEIRTQQQSILDEIKAGNQEAKQAFEELRQEQHQNLEQLKEQYQEQKQEIINKIQSGSQEAVEELKQLNQEQQTAREQIRQEVQLKVGEIKQEIIGEKQELLEQMQQNKVQMQQQIKNNNSAGNQ